jgi:hypothetical protein
MDVTMSSARSRASCGGSSSCLGPLRRREAAGREENAGYQETQGKPQASLFNEGNCRKEEKMKIHQFQELLALKQPPLPTARLRFCR